MHTRQLNRNVSGDKRRDYRLILCVITHESCGAYVASTILNVPYLPAAYEILCAAASTHKLEKPLNALLGMYSAWAKRKKDSFNQPLTYLTAERLYTVLSVRMYDTLKRDKWLNAIVQYARAIPENTKVALFWY